VNPSADNLAVAWRSIDALCSTFLEADWKQPTGCPGWTVQDALAHLVDYESRAVGRPAPEHTPSDVSHTKNDRGRSNEVGVDYRRARRGAEVLEEFREVTAARVAQMHRWTDEDLQREMMTPVGPGTVADMLTLRVMDTWTHEQDIRRAVGRPGSTDGAVADEAIAYFSRFLPYVVGKRAAAPDGATVVFEIGPGRRVRVEVVDGRARITESEPPSPTVTIAMPPTTFAALVGGRADVPDDVSIEGDRTIGRAVVESLVLMP
jgi:uncharacterized protein (TIGR03083 family)